MTKLTCLFPWYVPVQRKTQTTDSYVLIVYDRFTRHRRHTKRGLSIPYTRRRVEPQPIAIGENCSLVRYGSGPFQELVTTTMSCVFVSVGAASFTAPPQFVDCHPSSSFSPPLLPPPLGGPTCCLGHRYRPGHKAIRLPSTYFWETFPLVSEARPTSLEHVRAHVSTRLDRGQSCSRGWSCVLCYSHIEGKVVVILFHLMRTVNGDPSNWLMPELLASSWP